MKESKKKCEPLSICGVVHKIEKLVEFDGKKLCFECLARDTILCSHCGKRIWVDYNAGNLSMPLCQECFDEHYTDCTECGRIIHREDAYYEDGCDEPLCYRCYENNRGHDYIEDYYYKHEPLTQIKFKKVYFLPIINQFLVRREKSLCRIPQALLLGFISFSDTSQ